MRHYIHDTWQVCGLVYIDAAPPCLPHRLRQVGLEAHTTILSNAQRTTLKQTFITPSIWYRSSVPAPPPAPYSVGTLYTVQNAPPPPPPPQQKYPEIRYQFPLHDGVSVVGFTATIHSSPKPRVIRGVVQEKAEARHTYTTAVAEGKAAGLLELIPEAADVFVTKLGNIPPATRVVVEVTYLGELKHDAQVDGLRLTIPMGVAPRFGSWPGDLVDVDVPVVRPQDFSGNDKGDGGLRITVDAQLPPSSQIQSVSSPSHQIAVSIGKTSKSASTDALSFNQASASLALTSLPASSSSLTTITTPFLEKDFILHLTASNLSTPQAVLERHPTIPNQHALMATLVPKFTLPSSTQRRKPEVVFVCDRSGSMGGKIPNLVSALRVFIKSLPQGVAFNIVSFGSRFSFLWKGQHGCSGSRAYSRESVAQAVSHVETFQADYGGTEMFWPLEAVFKEWQSTRDADVAADAAPRDLEVFLLTDGEVWNQAELLAMVERNVRESEGHIRVFSLGIGSGASTSLIEGVARVGNGFAQSVVDGEDMSGKVVRMVKGAMFEHVRDYRLEVKYGGEEEPDRGGDDDGFEVVEKVEDMMVVDEKNEEGGAAPPPAYAESTASSATMSETTTEKPPPPAKISLFDENVDMSVDPPNHDNLPAFADQFADLRPCPPPAILQTPFEIPPLFPFNRTTVYLLFNSPFPKDKRGRALFPKSVVLRGTTAGGAPLELEIPVAVLPEPGLTIHQLATRKAVQELEEGKGWIYYARAAGGDPAAAEDSAREVTRSDGKVVDMALLRNRLAKSTFSAMVQREAVRLGVTFQVGGGKWSSFVAVEDTPPASSSSPSGVAVEGEEKEKENNKGATSTTYTPNRSMDPDVPDPAQAFPGIPQRLAQPVAQAQASNSLAKSMGKRVMGMFSRAAPAAKPTTNNAVIGYGSGRRTAGAESSSASASASFFGAASFGAPPPGGGFGGQQQQQQLQQQQRQMLHMLNVQQCSAVPMPFAAPAAAAAAPPPPPPAPAPAPAPADGGFHMDFANPNMSENVLQDFDFDSFLSADEGLVLDMGVDDNLDGGSRGGGGGGGGAPSLSGFASPQSFDLAAPVMRQENKKRKKMYSIKRVSSSSTTSRAEAKDADQDDDDEESGAAAGEFQLPGDIASATAREKMDAMVRVQGFDGAWTWRDLLRLMGWTEDKVVQVSKEVGKLDLEKLDAAQKDLFATAVVVVWFRKEMADMVDSWELLVDKAVERLGEDDARLLWQAQGNEVDGLLEEATRIFEKLAEK